MEAFKKTHNNNNNFEKKISTVNSSLNHHNFNGNDIPHLKIKPDMDIEELVEIFANSGYNARQLGEAAQLYRKMIEEDATICLTISGALTPVGFGGLFKTIIEKGLVDWVITTGANVYHEEHFASGLPLKQGHFDVDDNILYKKKIVRIRDVFIKGEETLKAQDKILQSMCEENFDKSFTTAQFCNTLGEYSKKNSKHPEKSFVIAAYDNDVPVYISTLKDSSLGLDMALLRFSNKIYKLDFVREIIEQAAIVYNSKKSGIVELGGGVPKNLAQQSWSLLDQVLGLGHGGQDYIIQITDARPDTGGSSGATLHENKSWGKIKDTNDFITIHADTTIAFPILCLYVLSNETSRKPKRLYKKLNKYYNDLQEKYLKKQSTTS